MFKIHNGTPRGDTNLCLSCTHAHWLEGRNLEAIIICTYHWQNPIRVNFPVVQCNKHEDGHKPTLARMYEIAWTVQSTNRGPVGFGEGAKLDVTITPPKKKDEETDASH